MDVRLPDGTIIRGVPDGMTKAELSAKLKANGYDLGDSAKTPEPTIPEKIAASIPVRFAVGAAEPVIGLAQRMGVDTSNDYDAYNKMAVAGGAPEGFDPARFAGNVLSPASLLIGKAGIPKTLLGKTALGAAAGGAGGFLAPANSNEEAFSNALSGMAVGGVATPLIYGGVKAGEWLANHVVKPAANLVSDSGPANILRNYIGKVVGEKQVPATVNAARNALATKTGPGIYDVPGYKPTVAEAMTGIPEGSPLARLQELTASTAGGPSAKFGQLANQRDVAIKAAIDARDAAAKPVRKAALDAANAKGGVNVANVLSVLRSEASKPANEASTLVNRSLSGVYEKIADRAANGKIDADALYTIRKELGNTIAGIAQKNDVPFDKGITAKIERQVQLLIDDAIEKSGGVGWKDYLREYAGKSRAIDRVTDTAEKMYTPVQKTNLGGGVNIAEETRPHAPNLLSREVMAGNFLLKLLGKRVEPKVDKLAAEIFSDPQAYANLMANTPGPMRFEVDRALRKANALYFGGANAQ